MGFGSTTGGSMSTGSGAVHEPDAAAVPAPLAESRGGAPGAASARAVDEGPPPGTQTLLGEDAVGLSATNIGRLTAVCVEV